MSKSKRATLIELIDYITEYVDENGLKGDVFDIDECKTVLEEVPFKNLKHGSSSIISDFPLKLSIKKIFDPFIKNITRYGTIHNGFADGENISLLFSILYCIMDNFKTLGHNEQKTFVSDFKNKILKDINSENLFEEYNLADLGWQKKELRSSIENYKNNRMSLRFLTNYLNVNIFLINIQENKIYSVYPEETFNIFKINIFLVYNNKIFEPLGYDENLLWNYKFEPFKKLINIDNQLICTLNSNFSKDCDEKIFQIGTEDIDIYLDKINNNNNDDIVNDNNFEEIEIVDTDTEVDRKFTQFLKKTKLHENEKINNNDGIFCKNKESSNDEYTNAKEEEDETDETDESSNDESTNSKEDEVDLTDIESLNSKSKLSEIQEVAKNHAVNLASGQTKNGKIKMKTKKQLFDELNSILDQ